jgi:phosphopantetheinyl transferase
MSKIFSQLNEVPLDCGEGEILLLTGGLDVLRHEKNTAGERARASLFEHRGARRFLAGRRLLRKALSGLMDCSPSDIDIETDEMGKPRLPCGRYHFSIAHSGETVGVTVARFPVGLDLEWERSVDEPGLSRRFFSGKEAAMFREEPDPALFFTLWTSREAAIKGDGRGLGRLLAATRTHSLPDEPDGTLEVRIGEDFWRVVHWREESGLHGAVACRGVPASISWCDLRGNAIL